ncbi:MAG: hypothetical protein AAGA68_02510 [Pseudomonadota bacterium]
MGAGLHIDAVGLVSSVGNTAEASCAAFRLVLDGFTETPFIDHLSKRPIIGAPIDWAQAPTLRGAERLAAMAATAVEDALGHAADTDDDGPVAVVACLAESQRPDVTAGQLASLRAALGEKIASAGDLHIISEGAVGLVDAFEYAATLLDGESAVQRVVVVGAESLLSSGAINYFLAGLGTPLCRLLTAGNSDGFIPGEAAAAIVLTGASDDERFGLRVRGMAMSERPEHEGQPPRAEALTDAVTQALAQAQIDIGDIAYRMSNANGEEHRFEEESLMLYRVCRPPRPDFPLVHLADKIGEVGAAAGVALMARAYWAAREGYAEGPAALCYLMGDQTRRAALVLDAVGKPLTQPSLASGTSP